ncbi:MAG: hypothetical protein KDI71_12110 [Xanthomonadales bacterium]|nr:hypothetical protein [Xanthomonadales bacterium]
MRVNQFPSVDERPGIGHALMAHCGWCHSNWQKGSDMTLCPLAIVAGCKKCPIFSVCPLKGVIGDQQSSEKTTEASAQAKKKQSN